jgi:hypothetical protein
MTFSFHPEAETEFLEAIDYYEDRERGLGYDFSIEALATIQNIVTYPREPLCFLALANPSSSKEKPVKAEILLLVRQLRSRQRLL